MSKLNRTAVAIALAVTTGLTVGSFLKAHREPELYYAPAIVSDVYEKHNEVFFADENGEVWSASVDDTSGFKLGDKYILTLNDMATSDPYDDEIVGIF